MRRLLVAAALMLAFPSFLTHAAAPPLAPITDVDMPAIVLTTTDLEAEGFDGYRVDAASPFSRATDVANVSNSQHLNHATVARNFAEADEQGSYFAIFTIRSDQSDRSSDPKWGIETGAYLFADAAGAKSGYAIITDESKLSNATDLPDVGQGLGDASEMTVYAIDKSPLYGIPVTQLELKIRLGRLVLEVSTFDYASDSAGSDTVDQAAVAGLEALGERLIDRADAALSGNSPNLTHVLLPVSTAANPIPYRIYSLLDGDPVQEAFEEDGALQGRVQDQHDRGMSSILRNQVLVYHDDGSTGDIWLYNDINQFESTDDATAYLDGLVDSLSQDPSVSSVKLIDTPELGDGALTIELQLPAGGGGVATRNELFVRQGSVVAMLWIAAVYPMPESPVVSASALETLGAAQAECLSASGCGEPVALPEHVTELTSDASFPAAGRPKLPEASEPTVDDLLARVEIFTNLSREHTDGPVDYEQIPPVGGMHSPVLQNCGFYSEPVGNEHAVHSLEHGAVWITYDPDLPAADVARLEALVEGHDFLLISPYEGLPSPVVASAWGVQLQLEGVDDPYLQIFIDFFEQGPQTPEVGALCSGGTSETVS